MRPGVSVGTVGGGGGDFVSELAPRRPTSGVSARSAVASVASKPPSALRPSPPSSARPSATAASPHKIVPPLALHNLLAASSLAVAAAPLSVTPHPAGGLGVSGFADGAASAALFNSPSGLALQRNSQGTLEALFITDTANHAVRRVDAITGAVSTIACRSDQRPVVPATTAAPSTSASSAPAVAPAASPFPVLLPLHSPSGLLLDPASSGTYLLLADSGNHLLRQLQLQDGSKKRGQHSRWAGGDGDLAAGSIKLGQDNEGDEEEEDQEADATHRAPASASSASDSSPVRPSTASRRAPIQPPSSLPAMPSIPALSAHFSHPSGLCWDSSQNVWVCDRTNDKIKRVGTTGLLSTMRAPQHALRLHRPQSIVADARGNLVFTDCDNHCIKRIAPDGTVSLLAGVPRRSGYRDGPANAALFSSPWGLSVEQSTNTIFVADSDNHAIRIITPGGLVRTIAGAGAREDGVTADAPSITQRSYTSRTSPGLTSGDSSLAQDLEAEEGYVNGSGALARFFRPRGLAFADGVLFVADAGNHCVRSVRITPVAAASSDVDALGASFAQLAPSEPFPSSRLGNDSSGSTSTLDSARGLGLPGGLNRYASMPAFAAATARARPSSARPPSRSFDRPSSGDSASKAPLGRLHQQAASSSIALAALEELAPPALVSEWTRVDVAFWLLGLSPNYDAYVQSFHSAKVDGVRLLAASDEAALTQLGVSSKLHRKMILREILRLKNPQDDLPDDTSDDDSASNSRAASRASSASTHRPRPATASGWRGSTPPATGPIVQEEFATNEDFEE